jgi:hypothetical protein
MTNVKMTRTGSTLTITVDLSVKGNPSKSGKSILLASTEGNATVPSAPEDNGAAIKIGLNIYKQ